MSPFTLSLHLFFGRPRLLLPKTSRLSDFTQMRLGSRLRQWPNHFSLVFQGSVNSTGFTDAPFLVSSFLMWSNLVFPLAHLNILISAEFCLFSSFFFTALHSEPYVIAGLMIVLKTLSFNSTGIFLSHITPDTSFHFIHPILILLLTSALKPLNKWHTILDIMISNRLPVFQRSMFNSSNQVIVTCMCACGCAYMRACAHGMRVCVCACVNHLLP